MSAAIYASRAGLKTLVMGRPEGSNVYKAKLIENYFGEADKLSGPDLLKKGKKKAAKCGAQFTESEAVDVKEDAGNKFKITDAFNKKYTAKSVIICTGFGFKSSGIKNENQFVGRGVSYCVTCDGLFFKNKKLAVIGNTNFAACEALHLKGYSKNVVILSNGLQFSLSPKMKKDLTTNGIKLVDCPRIISIDGKAKAEAVVFSDGGRQKFDGIFVAVGIAGASDFASRLGIERTGPQNSFIVIDPRSGRTNVKGIFAAGDCTGGNAQIAKSVGEGCNAAISVIEFFRGVSKYVDYC